MTLEFRERSGTKTIHIFDSDDRREGHSLIPICGKKMGGLTYPLDPLDDVEKKGVCKQCLRCSSKR